MPDLPMPNKNPDKNKDKDSTKTSEDIQKGEPVNILEKEPGLKKISVAGGWDAIGFDGEPADLDVSLFLLNSEDLTRGDDDFIFFNHPENENQSVRHKGDSRTGAGDGDDEIIELNLSELDLDITKIVFVLSIYNPEDTGHTFEGVRNSFFRLKSEQTGREIFRYFLDDELRSSPRATACVIGDLTRRGTDWLFTARADMIENGLRDLATRYGMIVAG